MWFFGTVEREKIIRAFSKDSCAHSWQAKTWTWCQGLNEGIYEESTTCFFCGHYLIESPKNVTRHATRSKGRLFPGYTLLQISSRQGKTQKRVLVTRETKKGSPELFSASWVQKHSMVYTVKSIRSHRGLRNTIENNPSSIYGRGETLQDMRKGIHKFWRPISSL